MGKDVGNVKGEDGATKEEGTKEYRDKEVGDMQKDWTPMEGVMNKNGESGTIVEGMGEV
jgi:hypothetical protein